MSDCAVCIGGGEVDGSNDFTTNVIVKARKPHTCCECDRPISIGTKYQRYSWKYDGYVSSAKTCLDCMNIREGLTCEDGARPYFGELWSDIKQNFPNLKSTACLTKIPTASAKEYFLDRWREWKFKQQTT